MNAHSFPEAKLNRPFITLWRFNRPYLRRYLIGAMLAMLFSVFNLAFPMVVRAVVASLAELHITGTRLGLYFALLLGVGLLSGIARYFQRTLMIGASRHFEYALRNAYFHKILTLSTRFFHRTPTGDIMARATSDVNHVRDFIGPGIMGTVDMLFLPFTLSMMIYLSPKLTLYALLPLPALTLFVYVLIRFMNRQSRIVQELFSDVSTRVQENIAGARVVRAYAVEDRETDAFETASLAYKRANILLATVMSFAWPLIDLLVGLTVLVIIYQGGRMVISGELALADFTAFLIVTAMLAWPLVQFGWVLTLYQRGAVSMGRISEILTLAPEIQDGEQTLPESRIETGSVRFDKVYFRYAPNPEGEESDKNWTLEDISFDAPAGKTTAIVGPTGSGKSTVFSLICREYEPNAGTVSIDGRDICQYPLETLRGAIGCALQDGFVFSDTIRENIGLGEETGEAIEKACETAQFSGDLAEMPDGLDTLLGERGVNLSGGQKQRLTLARALVRDPVILLLDDTLSSVDADTEQAILTGLRNVMRSRTCLIISHRLSAVALADQILVLDKGRVVERGVHDTLVRANGIYERMYRRQMLEAKLEQET